MCFKIFLDINRHLSLNVNQNSSAPAGNLVDENGSSCAKNDFCMAKLILGTVVHYHSHKVGGYRYIRIDKALSEP